MSYRMFDTGTWEDPWFEDLSAKAKLAFIYLWTNKTCNAAGIYEISEKRIKFELGYGIDTVYSELKQKIYWDQSRKLVWIKNFFRRQTQNHKFAISALNSIKDDPYKLRLFIEYNRDILESYKNKEGNPLINLAAYEFDPSEIGYGYGIDTLSPSTETETETETVTEAETEAEGGTELPGTSVQPAADPPVLTIPLVSKEKYPIYQSDIDEWQDAYPAVDVLQELRHIRQWNLSKPKKRKTKSGIRGHITTWLGKEQDKAGSRWSSSARKPASTTAADSDDLSKYENLDEDVLYV